MQLARYCGFYYVYVCIFMYKTEILSKQLHNA